MLDSAKKSTCQQTLRQPGRSQAKAYLTSLDRRAFVALLVTVAGRHHARCGTLPAGLHGWSTGSFSAGP